MADTTRDSASVSMDERRGFGSGSLSCSRARKAIVHNKARVILSSKAISGFMEMTFDISPLPQRRADRKRSTRDFYP